ncbi:hypothetical protein NQ176_g4205 [Zarea fungicola]|uniref:Uncharacterized protein n=1 Tax=Zarea fungicola TaxID=93591 RepID=A0ACC1NFR9_9HYPO|nr:hypothetical protein NQ176_g4205 [Lecanicillium fungicola]
MATIRDICSFLIGWDGPGFMEVYDSFSEIISLVAPDLIIVDLLMTPAISAAWNSGIRMSNLSPNSIKDFVGVYQPYLGFLWKYPALMSGCDYPVPWYQRLLNVFHCFHLIYRILKEPSLAATKKHVSEKIGKPMRSMMDNGSSLPDYAKIFVGTLPELGFPLRSHTRIVPFGTIISEAPQSLTLTRSLPPGSPMVRLFT